MKMTDASARGKSSRSKGSRGEREFAALAREELGICVQRNLKQYQQKQEGDLTPIGPYLVEVKNHARPNPKAWWQQAVEQAKRAGLKPALAYKVPRKGFRVVISHDVAQNDGFEWTIDMAPCLFFMLVRESL